MIEHPYPDKLSIAMIVKDEEKNIKRCLDSILPIADEVIINDTGSTDRTKEIIAEYNGIVRLISSKWQNNFSEARNTALKFCSYGWIMWIDADDYIPPESILLIQKMKKRELDSFYYFNVINTIDGLPNGSSFLQCRMFPNSDNIQFQYPVHENISLNCVKAGLTAYNVNNIKIYHTGYEDGSLKKQKGQRNIALIKTIPNYSLSKYWLKSLGICYEMKNDFESAYSYYFGAMVIEKTPEIYCKLGNVKMRMKEYKAAIEYFLLGLEMNAENMEMTYHLAKTYEDSKDFDKAMHYYERVLKLPEVLTTGINYYHQCRIYTYHYLLRIYTAYAMHHKASKLVENININYPKHRVDDD